MTLGDIIKRYRESTGDSMDSFAKKSGLSKAYISILERNINPISNKPPIPSLEKIKAVAAVVGIELDELIAMLDGNQLVSLAKDDSTSGSIVPVRYLGEVAAGFDHIAYEEYEYLNVPEEWLHGHPASDYFAMRVTGSSMYPEYRDGDEILCLHCDDMGRSGRVGVFVYGEEATLKKIEYVHGEDWVDLVPINPEYETKRIEGADLERCRVIGRAVRLIRTINQ